LIEECITRAFVVKNRHDGSSRTICGSVVELSFKIRVFAVEGVLARGVESNEFQSVEPVVSGYLENVINIAI